MLTDMGKRAKAAAMVLYNASSETKDLALTYAAEALIANQETILAANAEDVEKGKASGLTNALIDRLTLTEERIKGIADGMLAVRDLPDPVGAVLDEFTHKNGMKIVRKRSRSES